MLIDLPAELLRAIVRIALLNPLRQWQAVCLVHVGKFLSSAIRPARASPRIIVDLAGSLCQPRREQSVPVHRLS